MLNSAQATRAHPLAAALAFCCLGLFAPTYGGAQPPDGVVPITSEPDHKIRFDNGIVRMIEVVLPQGRTTLFHEHLYDYFHVFFQTAEVTSEPLKGKAVPTTIPAGGVHFTSTSNGPYAHRVIASGKDTVHVIATELLTPAGSGAASGSQDRFPPFEVALENSRGRAYRLKLNPGEATEPFIRPAGTAIFAISSGRISENPDGKPTRLWDFEPGHFRYVEKGESVTVTNESPIPVELIEIDVY
jgi:mannose-6-phosphate isomerase-like protein (cupin superfamily)